MSQSEFDPNNVLLLEDNPKQFGILAMNINIREQMEIFPQELLSEEVPYITTYSKKLDKFFNLKVLQHPVEMKEFIQLIH